MPFTPKQHRERRVKARKEGGICTVCYGETGKGREDLVVCEKCATRSTETKRRLRKDKTRCYTCLNKLNEFDLAIGAGSCQSCKERTNIAQRRRRNAKK